MTQTPNIAVADLLHLAFQTAEAALVLVDGVGRIVEVNDASAALLGKPAEELLGQDLSGVIAPARQSHLGNQSEHHLVRLVADSVEQALRQAEKLDSLGVLAGGVAHKFNNLLTSVLGFASLARTEAGISPMVRSCLQHIEDAARQAADVSHKMLAYSGRGQTSLAPIDLSALVRQRAALLEVVIPPRLTLHLSLADGLAPVLADGNLIGQCLLYLITNSVEAADPGTTGPTPGRDLGLIQISTSALSLTRERLQELQLVGELAPGPHVVLEVSDTGCGTDGRTKARIFEPFFTTKFQGRGLGLSAVHGIVRGHRGAVEVSSQPGRGTTFRLYFPCIEATVSPLASTLEQVAALTGQGSVLIVDDEVGVRTFTGYVLQRHGLTPIYAANGQEALEVLEKHAGDIRVVLLDMVMPQMDGPTALAEIQRRWPTLKVVLMSDENDRELQQRSGRSSVGYLDKPFTHHDLEAVIAAVLTHQPS